MYVNHRFQLLSSFVEHIQELKPKFGYNGFGEVIFYTRYSRKGESWNDCVIRVINGVMSIRKDWYLKNHIKWEEEAWQHFAYLMALSMFEMKWLPPGRGLWAMGTDLIYERGAMPLVNCAFTQIGDKWVDDLCWLMDSLMNGVGVGFEPIRDRSLILHSPHSCYPYVIADSREGWVDSVKCLLMSYVKGSPQPFFYYTQIRKQGEPIRSFGGTASGPGPLRDLHSEICDYCTKYISDDTYDSVMFKTDLANLIGCCVVTGNVRRSAEIAIAPISDSVFMDLKDYDKHSYRKGHGFMSNNSVKLNCADDFERMEEIAQRVRLNGEPGYLNMINLRKGRLGHDDLLLPDEAVGINPCGEIPLENREICNVVETLPTRCLDVDDWYDTCRYATFYASTVTLLPTHQPTTNATILRNRRIGVGIIDLSGWFHTNGICKVTSWLRKGYDVVRRVNAKLARDAGIPVSNRVTTIKPGGTVPKLAGRTSGLGHPTFHHTLRRIRIQEGTAVEAFLIAHGIPHEPDFYTKMTTTFEFPILQGPAAKAQDVSLWQQAMNLVLLQREWADNAVSNTLYFNSDEADDVEAVLSAIAPMTKSVSLLPHTNAGCYPQMPEEGITQEEYAKRVVNLEKIDWRSFKAVEDTRDSDTYCEGDHCAIPAR